MWLVPAGCRRRRARFWQVSFESVTMSSEARSDGNVCLPERQAPVPRFLAAARSDSFRRRMCSTYGAGRRDRQLPRQGGGEPVWGRSDLAGERYNNCANRCYYACFQASIAALLAAGIQARSPGGRWRHDHIQAQFAGELINRRRRFPPSLRRGLSDNLELRQRADYETYGISGVQATRAVRPSREFVEAIRRERSNRT